jgi:hypothetical protein
VVVDLLPQLVEALLDVLLDARRHASILPSVDYDAGVRVALVALAFLVLAGSASAATFFFRMPSSNIGCVYSSEPGGGGPFLRCDILSGLKPAPQRPRGCTVDWKYGYRMRPTGRALTVCAGDTAVDRRAKAIPYGHRWLRGGFTCLSRKVGLRCRNRSGHGFFLSKRHSYRF